MHLPIDHPALDVRLARSAPPSAAVMGVGVATSGAVPRSVGMNRKVLEQHGFTGARASTLVVPSSSSATVVVVGLGDPDAIDTAVLRDAAAALARAVPGWNHVATNLVDAGVAAGLDAAEAAAAVVEGVRLATYRYLALKKDRSSAPSIDTLTLVVAAKSASAAAQGADRGLVIADAVRLARDLINTPPVHLTATRMAEVAAQVASRSGLGIEVLDEQGLIEANCQGLLNVNRGSTEPARLITLTYRPRNAKGHVALVGKGVMYDSGGISLKPSDGMHAMMKMDMSGAAAVLATMSTVSALGCTSAVTGYLVCTDNMPSGSALKLGDVISYRNGVTAEIHNTDAEGRLILADGLILAAEEKPDAIIDIATLTGACMAALGTKMAGVLGNDQDLVDRVRESSQWVDELVWQLPLHRPYRKLLDSQVADMRNIGGPYAGTITAALFLSEFVGEVPWVHLDIAGPMSSDADDGWLTRGGTGFGTRLLIDVVTHHGRGRSR
jgi:leucyl aminopeptidase